MISPDAIPLGAAILVAVALLVKFGGPTIKPLLVLSIASIFAVIWTR